MQRGYWHGTSPFLYIVHFPDRLIWEHQFETSNLQLQITVISATDLTFANHTAALRCPESRFAVRSDLNRHRFAAISDRMIQIPRPKPVRMAVKAFLFSLLGYQGAAKGGRQKDFDHFFLFSGLFRSLLGHFFWCFCQFFRPLFAKLLLPDSFCGRVRIGFKSRRFDSLAI